MRRAVAVLSLLLVSGVAFGQDPLTFKNSQLGQTLEDFKTHNNARSMNAEYHGVDKKNKPTVRYVLVSEPFCTDTNEGEQILERILLAKPARADASNPTIRCVLAPAEESMTVAGLPMAAIVYTFHEGRLAAITLAFIAEAYRFVLDGFIAKYGQPTSQNEVPFQNAFGASWKGAESHWTIGHQFIDLVEGSGDGPGQDEKRTGATGYANIYVEPSSQHKNTPRDF